MTLIMSSQPSLKSTFCDFPYSILFENVLQNLLTFENLRVPIKILQRYWSLNGESSKRLVIKHESINNVSIRKKNCKN